MSKLETTEVIPRQIHLKPIGDSSLFLPYVQEEYKNSGCLIISLCYSSGFPGRSDRKESACNAGDPGSIARWERSPGEGNSSPLQCSRLENSMDRGATVHGVAKSRTQLSDFTFIFFCYSSVKFVFNLISVKHASEGNTPVTNRLILREPILISA